MLRFKMIPRFSTFVKFFAFLITFTDPKKWLDKIPVLVQNTFRWTYNKIFLIKMLTFQ